MPCFHASQYRVLWWDRVRYSREWFWWSFVLNERIVVAMFESHDLVFRTKDCSFELFVVSPISLFLFDRKILVCNVPWFLIIFVLSIREFCFRQYRRLFQFPLVFVGEGRELEERVERRENTCNSRAPASSSFSRSYADRRKHECFAWRVRDYGDFRRNSLCLWFTRRTSASWTCVSSNRSDIVLHRAEKNVTNDLSDTSYLKIT